MLKQFFSKDFTSYIKKLIIISIPIILAQLFVNVASLIDTLMVGQLDDVSISGVYIANQIVFVCNLLIFGAVEGGGVFICQFKGAKDEKNITKSFIYKIYLSIFVGLIATLVVYIFRYNLSKMFNASEEAIIVSCKYLEFLAFSFIPLAITNSISSTLRELDHPIIPMVITFIGIVINIIINYICIFGKLNITPMGATGAAIGTITEKVLVSLTFVILVLIKKYPFTHNFIKNLKIEKTLFKDLTLRSIPLLINEGLWSLGQTALVTQFTKVDSIASVVLPISSTIFNLVFVFCIGLSNGISILVGEEIGKSNMDESQKKGYYSLFFSFLSSVILGIFLFILAPFIVSLYTGISIPAREIAQTLIRFNSLYLIIQSVNTSIFFLLRSGGKTEVVLVFDSLYAWILQVPFAILLLHITNLELVPFFIIIYSLDILKLIIGMILVIKRKWIKNITLKHSN